MNLVEYQSDLERMIESRDFEVRSQLEQLATLSPAHQQVWEDFLIIEQTLPAWKHAVPEIDLVEAVMSQLAEPDIISPPAIPSAKPSSLYRLYGGLLIAAVLLIAVSLQFSGNSPETITPNTVATSTQIAPVTPSPQENAPHHSINQLLRNAGTASWGLAQSTAGTMTEAVSLVPVPRRVETTNSTVPEESNWVEDINHEMQPLKDQISHAWNFILHSVPEESTRI